MGQRRGQVLDAALRVLGAQGARGLSHQAVDRTAQVPAGTASNHFRTRQSLLRAAVERLVELDHAAWDAFTRMPPTDVDEAVEVLTGLVRDAAGPGRVHTRARFTLFLESAGDPEIAALLAGGRAAVLDRGARWLTELAVPEPRERFRGIAAHVDGAILHRLTFPDEPADPAAAFRALLTAHPTPVPPENAR